MLNWFQRLKKGNAVVASLSTLAYSVNKEVNRCMTSLCKKALAVKRESVLSVSDTIFPSVFYFLHFQFSMDEL